MPAAALICAWPNTLVASLRLTPVTTVFNHLCVLWAQSWARAEAAHSIATSAMQLP